MNFLAHFYLSGTDEALSVGNYLGDFITSKERDQLPPDIIKGVHLHHEIDRFTDSHLKFKNSVASLRPKYKRYAPVIADIFFDHFLAKTWDIHHENPLQDYANNCYALIDKHENLLTDRAKRFQYYMKSRNILYNYQHLKDLELVFFGMSRRASFDSGMENSVDFLRDNYQLLNDDFDAFFPDIKAHIIEFIKDH